MFFEIAENLEKHLFHLLLFKLVGIEFSNTNLFIITSTKGVPHILTKTIYFATNDYRKMK